jgi:transposase
MLHDIRRSPRAFGKPQARWTLRSLLQIWDWLHLHTAAGLQQLLKRLKIHWKRGRHHVHSPDPDYVAKLQDVRVHVRRVSKDIEQSILIFTDEFTLYRRPSLAQDYELAGQKRPLADLGYKSNYSWRIAAGLELLSGQVVYAQSKYMDIPHLTHFYRQLCQVFPGREIILVEDNWSIHYHPDLLAALHPQTFLYPLHRPTNWSITPNPSTPLLNLPIQLGFLPTYASWNNPIEKLWRWLQQDVTHHHDFGDDWVALKGAVFHFLDQFAHGSVDLLKYVGLSNPFQLYQALFPA